LPELTDDEDIWVPPGRFTYMAHPWGYCERVREIEDGERGRLPEGTRVKFSKWGTINFPRRKYREGELVRNVGTSCRIRFDGRKYTESFARCFVVPE
jgi:hypothetical protein